MTDWTPQQEAVFEDVAYGFGNSFIQARAGSGKTTTIEEAIRRAPADLSVCYLAFSKQVVKEAKSRLWHPNLHVATCHSLGYRAIRESYGPVDVDHERVLKLASKLTPKKNRQYLLAKAVSLAKNHMVDDEEDLVFLMDEHGIDADGPLDWLARDALTLLSQCENVEDGTVDHDDQIWLPIMKSDIQVPQFDHVFVDEAQDLNPPQIELVFKALAPGGRITFVGDDKQAIFLFRGADERAVPKLIARAQAKVLPLSTTFRCAVNIVKEAKTYVPDIEARANAPDGEVRTATYEQMIEEAEYGDFILSRTNAPLIGIALELASQDCRVSILGREIGQGLVTLIYKQKAGSVSELRTKISAWYTKEAARLAKKNPPQTSAIELAADRRDCVLQLADKAESVDHVVQRARDLFENATPKNCVTLATTHKAKGLERNRVWMLRKTYLRPFKGGSMDEEKNIAYVAITRAKNELIYVK